MVPIVLNEKKEINNDEFKEYFLQICRKHKSEKRALAFAFIVYDFENYTITEILNKSNYWSSLDIISGKSLSIFYINSQDSYYKRRQNEIYLEQLRQEKRNSQSETFSFLVPITEKPTPTENAIAFVKSEFGLNENIKTPFVLFFQIDNDDNISDSFIVKLKQEKLEDAFLELKSHIKNAVESIGKVIPECYKNYQEIFYLIKCGVESGKFFDLINQKVISKLGIGTIISFIKLFSDGN